MEDRLGGSKIKLEGPPAAAAGPFKIPWPTSTEACCAGPKLSQGAAFEEVAATLGQVAGVVFITIGTHHIQGHGQGVLAHVQEETISRSRPECLAHEQSLQLNTRILEHGVRRTSSSQTPYSETSAEMQQSSNSQQVSCAHAVPSESNKACGQGFGALHSHVQGVESFNTADPLTCADKHSMHGALAEQSNIAAAPAKPSGTDTLVAIQFAGQPIMSCQAAHPSATGTASAKEARMTETNTPAASLACSSAATAAIDAAAETAAMTATLDAVAAKEVATTRRNTVLDAPAAAAPAAAVHAADDKGPSSNAPQAAASSNTSQRSTSIDLKHALIIKPNLVVCFNGHVVRALSLSSGRTKLQVELDGELQLPVWDMCLSRHNLVGLSGTLSRSLRPVAEGTYFRGCRLSQDGTLLLVLSRNECWRMTPGDYRTVQDIQPSRPPALPSSGEQQAAQTAQAAQPLSRVSNHTSQIEQDGPVPGMLTNHGCRSKHTERTLQQFQERRQERNGVFAVPPSTAEALMAVASTGGAAAAAAAITAATVATVAATRQGTLTLPWRPPSAAQSTSESQSVCQGATLALVIGPSLRVGLSIAVVRALSLSPGRVWVLVEVDGVREGPVCDTRLSCPDGCVGLELSLSSCLRAQVEGSFHRGLRRSQDGTLLLVLSRTNNMSITLEECMEPHTSNEAQPRGPVKALVVKPSLLVRVSGDVTKELSLLPGRISTLVQVDGCQQDLLALESHLRLCSPTEGLRLSVSTLLRGFVEGAFHRGWQRFGDGTLLLVLSRIDSSRMTLQECKEVPTHKLQQLLPAQTQAHRLQPVPSTSQLSADAFIQQPSAAAFKQLGQPSLPRTTHPKAAARSAATTSQMSNNTMRQHKRPAAPSLQRLGCQLASPSSRGGNTKVVAGTVSDSNRNSEGEEEYLLGRRCSKHMHPSNPRQAGQAALACASSSAPGGPVGVSQKFRYDEETVFEIFSTIEMGRHDTPVRVFGGQGQGVAMFGLNDLLLATGYCNGAHHKVKMILKASLYGGPDLPLSGQVARGKFHRCGHLQDVATAETAMKFLQAAVATVETHKEATLALIKDLGTLASKGRPTATKQVQGDSSKGGPVSVDIEVISIDFTDSDEDDAMEEVPQVHPNSNLHQGDEKHKPRAQSGADGLQPQFQALPSVALVKANSAVAAEAAAASAVAAKAAVASAAEAATAATAVRHRPTQCSGTQGFRAPLASVIRSEMEPTAVVASKVRNAAAFTALQTGPVSRYACTVTDETHTQPNQSQPGTHPSLFGPSDMLGMLSPREGAAQKPASQQKQQLHPQAQQQQLPEWSERLHEHQEPVLGHDMPNRGILPDFQPLLVDAPLLLLLPKEAFPRLCEPLPELDSDTRVEDRKGQVTGMMLIIFDWLQLSDEEAGKLMLEILVWGSEKLHRFVGDHELLRSACSQNNEVIARQELDNIFKL